MKMNENNKKLNEEQIRRWIRHIIKENSTNSRMLLEYMDFGHTVTPQQGYDTFIGPFVDVLKVAKVAGKDILSSAKLNFDLLITFDTDKMKAHGEKWKARKSKIDGEYAEVMKSTTEALSTGDAALLSFMINPVGFLSVKAAKSGIKATGGAAQFLEDSGISVPLAGLLGMTDNLTKPEDPKDRGVIGGAIHGLAKLFFIAHNAPEGNILVEAEDEEAEKKPVNDFEAELRELFEETGLLNKIEADAKELVTAKIEVVDTVMDDLRSKAKVLGPIYKATTAEEFVGAIEAAKSGGHDIGGGGLAAVGAELKKSVDKMIAEPKSKETLVAAVLKSQGKKAPKPDSGEEAPEVDEGLLRKEAEKIVFMQSKQGAQEKIYEGVSSMKKTAIAMIQEDLPPEGEWDIMASAPSGKELVDKVKDAMSEIKAS